MIASLQHNNITYNVDLSKPLDISIPLDGTSRNPIAWYLDKPVIEPVTNEDWTGSVSKGAAINFNNIRFNPHAHGTHTECLGHITEEFHSVQKSLKNYFYIATVISVAPELKNGDMVISRKQLKGILKGNSSEALVIRTLPNTTSKKSRKYSHTNWPYLEESAAKFIREIGVEHLLVDLPSVDKEKDAGKLKAHKAFWNYPEDPRLKATITEFVYVSNRISDGTYLLNLQTAPFVNDATPSRPLLYKITYL
ncbi:MAG: cyclase family protein [Bacteroidia bacterium]|nr:cyclase family protein [Bacteroidia bacterium]NNF31701.1 cyclase family protein [Flavobacteriaceae bacterium]NNJ81560.1 cyclase family protein [Flavobacteriaceae bacterium]NNK55215.1 cyclase family protein [Flavobacteriaceae bacterium]NNM10210.1 cyclase family protein [Flavobacteriaceae bacterium]